MVVILTAKSWRGEMSPSSAGSSLGYLAASWLCGDHPCAGFCSAAVFENVILIFISPQGTQLPAWSHHHPDFPPKLVCFCVHQLDYDIEVVHCHLAGTCAGPTVSLGKWLHTAQGFSVLFVCWFPIPLWPCRCNGWVFSWPSKALVTGTDAGLCAPIFSFP